MVMTQDAAQELLHLRVTARIANRERHRREVACLFPCPGEVLRLRTSVNGVALVGQTLERWEARRRYEVACFRGLRALLVERERAHLVRVRVWGLEGAGLAEVQFDLGPASPPGAEAAPTCSFLGLPGHSETSVREQESRDLSAKQAFDVHGLAFAENCPAELLPGAQPKVQPASPLWAESSAGGVPRAGLVRPLPADSRGLLPRRLLDLDDAVQELMEGGLATPEKVSQILRVLDCESRSARTLARVAGLLHEGERWLRLLCQEREPSPERFGCWLTRLSGFLRAERN